MGSKSEVQKMYNIIRVCDSKAETFLLENKVNVSTMLNMAIKREELPVVKFLVSNTDVSTYLDDSAVLAFLTENSPLFCRNKKPAITQFLLENKADVTTKNNIIIREAAGHSDLSFLKFLVENNADVNAEEGSPIIQAVKFNKLDNVKFLVENGADIEVRENLPIEAAIINNNLECIEYLISKGAVPSPILMNDKLKVTLAERKYFPKYFKRWRKFIFKSFFCNIVTPLYYSPGFPGYLKAQEHFQELL